MPAVSWARTVPTEQLWPMNSYWDYHCANPDGVFRNLRYFTPPLNARYGPSADAASYLLKAQVAAYEGHRAMFEGYSRNKYTSTGVIQWMLNNAWPEMVWHLYDFYFTPGGSYFGAKKACAEPLHPLYSYHDQSVWLVHSQYVDVSEPVNVTAQVVDFQGRSLLAGPLSMEVPQVKADDSLRLFTVPLDSSTLPPVYFLRFVHVVVVVRVLCALHAGALGGHEALTYRMWLCGR